MMYYNDLDKAVTEYLELQATLNEKAGMRLPFPEFGLYDDTASYDDVMKVKKKRFAEAKAIFKEAK